MCHIVDLFEYSSACQVGRECDLLLTALEDESSCLQTNNSPLLEVFISGLLGNPTHVRHYEKKNWHIERCVNIIWGRSLLLEFISEWNERGGRKLRPRGMVFQRSQSTREMVPPWMKSSLISSVKTILTPKPAKEMYKLVYLRSCLQNVTLLLENGQVETRSMAERSWWADGQVEKDYEIGPAVDHQVI